MNLEEARAAKEDLKAFLRDEWIPWSLDAAADLLETRGRCRGRPEDGEGRLCALAAISEVTGEGEPYELVSTVLGLYLHSDPEAWPPNFSVIGFNDETEDDEEVIRAFRDCAQALRGGDNELVK